MMAMIKGIIFDVGDVIIRIPKRKYHEYLHKKSGLGVAEVEKIIKRSLPRAERGEVRMSVFTKELSGKFGIKSSELQWLMPLKDAEVDPDMIELVSELHDDYLTAYLTNVDRSRYIYSSRIIGYEHFDFKFVSCYMHMVKPEPRIYRAVLKEMGLKPEEAVFIDNEPENVKSARALGIHAIRFHSRRAIDISLSKLVI